MLQVTRNQSTGLKKPCFCAMDRAELEWSQLAAGVAASGEHPSSS
jgi:hypothetical protein